QPEASSKPWHELVAVPEGECVMWNHCYLRSKQRGGRSARDVSILVRVASRDLPCTRDVAGNPDLNSVRASAACLDDPRRIIRINRPRIRPIQLVNGRCQRK